MALPDQRETINTPAPDGSEGVGRTPRVLAVGSTPESTSVSIGRWCPFSETTKQTHQHPSGDSRV